jgi:para-aminobenzoate synthetase
MDRTEEEILTRVERIQEEVRRPVVVALDGGSGAGKTTIAEKLMTRTDIALVPLDDFYQTAVPESKWPDKTVEQRLFEVFDWIRVRSEAIEPLRAGYPARYHPFDFMSGLNQSGTYSLQKHVKEIGAAPVILIDGAYSASPPLRDLIDLAVLISVPKNERHSRIHARGDDLAFAEAWHQTWDDVEAYYFEHVNPPESFDLVIPNGDFADSDFGIPCP